MRVLLAEWGEEGGQTLAVSVPLAQRSCLSAHCGNTACLLWLLGTVGGNEGKLGGLGLGFGTDCTPKFMIVQEHKCVSLCEGCH